MYKWYIRYFTDTWYFSVGGCWGQPMLLFWKLVDETQMPTTLEATRHHDSRKVLILLSLRAISIWDTLYSKWSTQITTYSQICLFSMYFDYNKSMTLNLENSQDSLRFTCKIKKIYIHRIFYMSRTGCSNWSLITKYIWKSMLGSCHLNRLSNDKKLSRILKILVVVFLDYSF